MDEKRLARDIYPHYEGEGAIVDCDVHALPPEFDTLAPFMDVYWRDYAGSSGFGGLNSAVLATYPHGLIASSPLWAESVQAWTSELGNVGKQTEEIQSTPLGLDVDDLRECVLHDGRIERVILICYAAIEALRNPDLADALASALNDWMVAEWLEKEPRLRASLVLGSGDPIAAAREIYRIGEHPGFVQVLLPVCSERPYGNRHYDPIFEAATRQGLVVGLHFGGHSENPPTPSGWPSYYIEEYVVAIHAFQSQVTSMVFEGTFSKFPTLRIAMLESGVSWLPSLMWRLDKEWRGLYRETPWVKRPPSAYIREHMRASTQPLDVSKDAEELLRLVDQVGTDDFFLFASNYPLLYPGTTQEEFISALPEPSQTKLMADNARRFYTLG